MARGNAGQQAHADVGRFALWARASTGPLAAAVPLARGAGNIGLHDGGELELVAYDWTSSHQAAN